MAQKKLNDREIEELYEEGIFKITQERNDFLVPQILDFVNAKRWVNLHPEYQRRLVWDKKKKSLFIESLLMNIPIPPIFLYEWDYSRYEVMDGQQRLNAIIEFYSNRFKLTGLEQWQSLNGKTYDDMPQLIKRALDRRRISATVLLAESTKKDGTENDLRKFVFERLNTGGQKLNAQELRNCIYSGKFNNLIVELAGNELFDKLWEIPSYKDHIRGGQISAELAENNLFKRMFDCEIVLRFFSFRIKSHVKGAVKLILDSCMERYQKADDDEIIVLRNLFISRLETSHAIFEENVFRIKDSHGKLRLSQPLFDGVMIAIDRLYEDKDTLIQKKKQIQEALNKSLEDPNVYDLLIGKQNTAPAIIKRNDFITELLKSYL
ncbi:hypothetical protein ABIC45_002709 [Mucilaginibacter rubeus]|uniref:DUF262 domain-containing protein n=1 Tax=Mucilaginibacter rubeus TaxID=2027860 RepID=UPI003395261A